MELYNPSTIKLIKHKYGFKFSKSLGQNFLTEYSVLEDMVMGAEVCEDDFVLEIGPGIGVLTAELCRTGAKVVALEIDRNLMEILDDTLSEFDNIKVIESDVLKTDLHELLKNENPEGRPIKVIGNLPYYITTPIIMKLLEEKIAAESITIMMQKEVAERLESPPGNRTYGAISVAVQYYSEIVHVVDVPKEVFMPQPKVDSTVLSLRPRKEPPVQLTSEKMFFRCIKAGFSQRRKTLQNALKSGGFPKDIVTECLEGAGIDPKRRAETLSVEDFAALSEQFCRNL